MSKKVYYFNLYISPPQIWLHIFVIQDMSELDSEDVIYSHSLHAPRA